jgi:hypothetical protein
MGKNGREHHVQNESIEQISVRISREWCHVLVNLIIRCDHEAALKFAFIFVPQIANNITDGVEFPLGFFSRVSEKHHWQASRTTTTSKYRQTVPG